MKISLNEESFRESKSNLRFFYIRTDSKLSTEKVHIKPPLYKLAYLYHLYLLLNIWTPRKLSILFLWQLWINLWIVRLKTNGQLPDVVMKGRQWNVVDLKNINSDLAHHEKITKLFGLKYIWEKTLIVIAKAVWIFSVRHNLQIFF